MNTFEFLRVYVAGITARIWRVLCDKPCPCGFCRDHRAFVQRFERQRGDKTKLTVPPKRTHLPTLAERQMRRYR